MGDGCLAGDARCPRAFHVLAGPRMMGALG